MAKHASLRASDADREQVAERLRAATVEGRLHHHEFEERLDLVLHARTFGELDRVMRDLPGKRIARRGVPAPATVTQVAIVASVAIVGLVVLLALAAAFLAAVGSVLVPLFIVAMIFGRRRHMHARSRRGGPPRRLPRGPAGPGIARW